MNPMLEPDDEELLRFAAGEVPAERAARLEAWARGEPSRAARVAEAKALVAALVPNQEPIDLLAGVERRIALRRRRTWQRRAIITAAAVACLSVWWARQPDEVRIKGTTLNADQWAGVELYRLEGTTPARLGETMEPNDSLLVAYRNGGQQPFTHLLVFGVASSGELYWYYPAWDNADDDPQAIAIEPNDRLLELHERITHELPRGRLVLHAVFARRPLRVSEIERLAAQANALSPLPLPETAQQRIVVEVQ
ncbi:MAG: hypothetical protein DI536_15145 [Archangium gephyra]|uniref:DUF4384 domain-containing protein n=1 Tax=Archangium gephyra TaxID=48 RepID=A0A2W5VP98_9BACT|nr:MAG: hypothetical protein DI536_15145 [Archangium gephyra]